MATAAEYPEICRRETGVCPEHGARLIWTPISRVCFCGGPGCERRWAYDRSTQSCTEPATKLVTTVDRYEFETEMYIPNPTETTATYAMCAGHAVVAQAKSGRFARVTVTDR